MLILRPCAAAARGKRPRSKAGTPRRFAKWRSELRAPHAPALRPRSTPARPAQQSCPVQRTLGLCGSASDATPRVEPWPLVCARGPTNVSSSCSIELGSTPPLVLRVHLPGLGAAMLSEPPRPMTAKRVIRFGRGAQLAAAATHWGCEQAGFRRCRAGVRTLYADQAAGAARANASTAAAAAVIAQALPLRKRVRGCHPRLSLHRPVLEAAHAVRALTQIRAVRSRA